MQLAAVVVVFASVPGITGCADLPLIADLGNIEGIEFVSQIQFNEGLMHYGPSGLFYPLCQMLVGLFFTTHEDGNSFMVSDFGWTVYLPSFGDHDPANTVPERLLVKKGVPTNTKTGERKFRVRDMTNVLGSGMMPCRRVTDRGMDYVPRCLSRVVKRTEYYGSRQNSFDLDIAFEVEERLDGETESRKFELNMSYRSFHDSLWGTFFTPACSHLKVDARGKCAITKLGPGIAAGTGLDWDGEGESDDEVPERVCVLLVRGDRRSRWLASQNAANSNLRSSMLRTDDCCDDCAVETAASRPGKWAVIL